MARKKRQEPVIKYNLVPMHKDAKDSSGKHLLDRRVELFERLKKLPKKRE